jgi:soluble lytic murein transglycosylase-like protein
MMRLPGRFSWVLSAAACAGGIAFVVPTGARAATVPAATAPKSAKKPAPAKAVAKKDADDEDDSAEGDVPRAPLTVEQLQDRLHLHKSVRARAIRKAYEALKAKQYDKARSLVAPLDKDPLFGDYSRWIQASADVEEGELRYKKKRYGDTSKLALRAATTLLQLEAANPYSSLVHGLHRDVSEAEVLAGDAFWASKKWKAAEGHYERAFQRLALLGGQGATYVPLRPENLAHYAESCRRHESELCPSWISKFGLVYPRGSEELKAIAKFFPSVGDKKPQRTWMRNWVPYHAPDLDQLAFDSAMQLYFKEKYSDAIKALQQCLDDFPRSYFRFRARYWLGQAFLHEKDKEKAQQTFESLSKESPLTYYGLLGSFAAGRGMDALVPAGAAQATESDPFLSPQESMRLKRAEAFIAEGAFPLAQLELKEFKPRDGLSSPFLMYLALLNHEARNFNGAFQVIGEVIQRGYDGAFSPFALKLIFPIAYLEQIQRHAAENKVDPILVLSLIKQESAFDPQAGSNVGALGLMQVMPVTAIEVEPKVVRADLTDVDTSIRVGTRYLKKLLTRYNGNIALALAAYNAGPAAVERWMKEFPAHGGMLEFIEAIPYRETREYVASIIRNYFWYSRRLTRDAPKTLGYFWNVYGPPESSPELPKQQPSG